MKSDFQERKENRINRLHELSKKAEEKSDSLYNESKRMGDCIPFGQPILVGHHSETRDRNFRNKIHNKMGASVKEADKANHYAGKARAAESNTSIFSDDPDAIQKLKAKIEAAVKNHKFMIAANKIIRSKLSDSEKIDKLSAMGLSTKIATEILKPDCFGCIGFATYVLSNDSANINRMKKRLKSLEIAETQETETFKIGEIEIIHNVEDNRTQIFFPGKPSEEIRQSLKFRGFRWARSIGAWQRHRTGYALRIAKEICEKAVINKNKEST